MTLLSFRNKLLLHRNPFIFINYFISCACFQLRKQETSYSGRLFMMPLETSTVRCQVYVHYYIHLSENSLCQSNKPLLCKNYQSVFINVCHCLLFFQYYKLTELQRNGCKLTHVVLVAIGVFVLDVWILLKFDNLIICNAYFHFKP